MYIARVTSFNQHWEAEWTRTLEAATKASAMRKAWKVVADCGADRRDARVTHCKGCTQIDVVTL